MTQNTEEWETRFDKQFNVIVDGDYASSSAYIANENDDAGEQDLENVKEFIRHTREAAKKDRDDEIIRNIQKWDEDFGWGNSGEEIISMIRKDEQFVKLTGVEDTPST